MRNGRGDGGAQLIELSAVAVLSEETAAAFILPTFTKPAQLYISGTPHRVPRGAASMSLGPYWQPSLIVAMIP